MQLITSFKFYLSLLTIILISGCFCAPRVSFAAQEPDMDDPCYAPTLPLTTALRTAFVDEVSMLGLVAERNHGVPAAILAAMSIQESGYGTTKLAIATNDILSYKTLKGPGPGVYILDCQPGADLDKSYPIFPDHAAAFDYVAGRLQHFSAYKTATADYQQAVRHGSDPRAAAAVWLRTIAPIYNPYETSDYIASILAIANDPIDKSGRLNVQTTLWRLVPPQQAGAAVQPAAAARIDSVTTGVANDPMIERVAQTMQLGRYMIDGQSCPVVTSDSAVGQNEIVAPYLAAISKSNASARGIRVIACTYQYHLTEPGGPLRTGYAVLLDLPKKVLATWIVTACRNAGIGAVSDCAITLSKKMLNSNGGQYPITGFVSEGVDGTDEDGNPTSECYQHSKPIPESGLIAFRYGITVQFDEKIVGTPPIYFCTTNPVTVDLQQKLALTEPVNRVAEIGRVAVINRACWPTPVSESVPSGIDPSQWQSIVNQSMLTAIQTDSDPMFNLAAQWLARSPTGYNAEAHDCAATAGETP